MISESKVVGVMNLQHYEANAFDKTDLALVSILANQAAISLENARLFEQVQNHNTELEQHVADRTRDLAKRMSVSKNSITSRTNFFRTSATSFAPRWPISSSICSCWPVAGPKNA